MIVTQEQAEKLWCPHSRVIYNAQDATARTHAAAAYNRASDPCVLNKCLGAGCMAWAWQEELNGRPESRRGACGLSVVPGPFEPVTIPATDGPAVEVPVGPATIKAAAARGAARTKSKG